MKKFSLKGNTSKYKDPSESDMSDMTDDQKNSIKHILKTENKLNDVCADLLRNRTGFFESYCR